MAMGEKQEVRRLQRRISELEEALVKTIKERDALQEYALRSDGIFFRVERFQTDEKAFKHSLEYLNSDELERKYPEAWETYAGTQKFPETFQVVLTKSDFLRVKRFSQVYGGRWEVLNATESGGD